MKIDAHQHFWNLQNVEYSWLVPEYGPIYRNFEPEDLQPILHATGIDRTVIIQSANSYADTDAMLAISQQHPWVAGVVGWVPLDQPQEADRKLRVYTKNPIFKGIRHLIHDESDPNWIIQPMVMEGLRVLASYGMTFDVVAVYPKHLKHVPQLAQEIPNLKLVIDHLAKPPIKAKGWESWATELAEAAKYPNVYAKISGLNTAASPEWSATELQPYVDYAIEQFGADRLMFGSDWPVAILQGDYAQVWHETNQALAKYSANEQAQILGDTAVKFYQLAT